MNQDFCEFFALLNARNVESLLISGVADNYRAPPRATKDIDLWVRPQRANLERLVGAVAESGFPVEDLDVVDLESSERVLMLGRVPNRIDVLTRPKGLDGTRCGHDASPPRSDPADRGDGLDRRQEATARRSLASLD